MFSDLKYFTLSLLILKKNQRIRGLVANTHAWESLRLHCLSLSSHSYTSHSPFCRFVLSSPSSPHLFIVASLFFQLTHMDMEEMVMKCYEIPRLVHCFCGKRVQQICVRLFSQTRSVAVLSRLRVRVLECFSISNNGKNDDAEMTNGEGV